MSKYLGPKLRLLRRLNALPDLTKKLVGKRLLLPGKYDNCSTDIVEEGYSSSDDYRSKLVEKQKVMRNYCLTNAKLKCLVFKALKTSNPALSLIASLELKIDTLLVRYGFCKTIPMARQELNHRRVYCNNKRVTSASYTCKKGDEISVKGSCKSRFLNEIKNLLLIAKDDLEENLDSYESLTDPDYEADFCFDSLEPTKPVLESTSVFESEILESEESEEDSDSLTDSEIDYLVSDSSFTSYLPSHLGLSLKTLSNKVLGLPRREEILLDFDEYKILEYYFK